MSTNADVFDVDFPAFTRHWLIILKYKTGVNFRF